MAQRVENHFVPGCFGVFIEFQRIHEIGKTVGKRAALFSSFGRCKHQSAVVLARKATSKDGCHFGIDEDLPAGFPIRFLAHGIIKMQVPGEIIKYLSHLKT